MVYRNRQKSKKNSTEREVTRGGMQSYSRRLTALKIFSSTRCNFFSVFLPVIFKPFFHP